MYEIYCLLRDSKGLKDADVSKATKIPQSTFSDWKNGRSKPKTEKLKKIADFFGVSVEHLSTGESFISLDILLKISKENNISLEEVTSDKDHILTTYLENHYLSEEEISSILEKRPIEEKLRYSYSLSNLGKFGDKTEEAEQYIDHDTASIAQEIFENRELRMLFDAAKNATPKRLKAYYDMIVAMEKAENHDED